MIRSFRCLLKFFNLGFKIFQVTFFALSESSLGSPVLRLAFLLM